MNKKLLLIINPVAGKMKSKNALFDIISVFCGYNFDVTVKLTKRRGHAAEITEAEYDKYDILVCVGGDGTLNEVVRGLIRTGGETPVGYIPAGSTNDFANSIGLPLDIKKAAETIAKGEATKLDIGSFKDVYFTYIASFGAFTSASYSTPQATKNAIGHIAYILEGIKDLSTIKPTHVKVEADGNVYEGDYIFGGIANSTSVGGIVKLKKELVDMSDGLFEVILIKNPRNLNHLNEIIIALMTSEYKNNKSIDYFNAASVKITSEDKLPFTVDGEYADGSGSFVVKNLKQRLTLIK
ncbi:MAG: diacylglycerol kinase family protein [Clostridia bacterium]|nr:diacylglycerol kinase family protein [Clostridia bacterium]